jgi:hypothetical protein
VYEWTWLQRQKDYAGIDQGLVTFVPLTLPSALVVAPLASLPALQAKRCWLGANLVFLLVTAGLLTRISHLNWRQVGLLMFLAFVPLRSNFMLGQMHVLILLLFTLALWLYLRGCPFASGMVLAVAASLKLYPALFLLVFLLKRQGRAAIGLAVGILSTAALSVYLFGRTACEVYVREILPAALRAETVDPYHVSWGSLTTLLRRLLIAEPELNPAPLSHLPWLYALLQPAIHVVIFVVFLLAIGTYEGDQRRIKRDWAMYIFLLLFVSSQPAGYHFVVLILVAVLVIDEMMSEQRRRLARLCLALYALVCLATYPLHAAAPTGWHTLLFFPRLGCMAICAASLLVWVLSPARRRPTERLGAAQQTLLALSMLILIVAGFYSSNKYLSAEFGNYRTRVATSPGSLFEANPVLTSDGILFTAMTKGGYTIRQAQAGTFRDLPRSHGDWFHPSLAQHSNWFWVEQATENGSRIVQVENTAATPTRPGVEIEDAMEPVVSRDGEWLAFLRAVKGQNSLWVQGIGSKSAASSSQTARQIAGPEYDVRDVDFLPAHRLIFSSGNGKLYLAGVETKGLSEFEVNCHARYPAVSPDRRWLAFSCKQKGNWQLHTIAFQDHAELQITNGECNSITPAWTSDSKSLIYATDCGRGVGLTALAKMNVTP